MKSEFSKVGPTGTERKSIRTKSVVEPRLYDLDAAAVYLGRVKSGVRELIYTGRLPVVQLGERGKMYLDIRDLEAFIEEHKRRLI